MNTPAGSVIPLSRLLRFLGGTPNWVRYLSPPASGYSRVWWHHQTSGMWFWEHRMLHFVQILMQDPEWLRVPDADGVWWSHLPTHYWFFEQ